MADTAETEEEREPVQFDVDYREDRAIITITGQRDGAVVLNTESGERIYLPPEDFVKRGAEEEEGFIDGPYQPAETHEDSAYQRADEDSAYQPGDDVQSSGRKSLPNGIRIIHPEPVDDVRFLR